MRVKKGPFNRRDAMSAEPDQSQPHEDVTLKGDCFERLVSPSFLCAHRVFAVLL
jgi:hypothetical protein